MRFRRTIASIIAVLSIGMCCVACGDIDYESSSAKSSANKAAASSPDDEAETVSAEASSQEQTPAATEEETETTVDLTTVGTTEAETLTTAEKKRTTTAAATDTTTATDTTIAAAVETTTENYKIREFQEYIPEEDSFDVDFSDIDESLKTSAMTDDAGYVSDYKAKHYIWLDVEKEIDYVFNGKFVKIRFKVKDDAPSGNYPVRLGSDISTITGKCINREVETCGGEIAVGKPSTGSNGIAGGGTASVYADNITAQPGETVDYYIYFDNNPGIAAFLLNISYDANAFEWISAEACGEFADIPSAKTMGSSD